MKSRPSTTSPKSARRFTNTANCSTAASAKPPTSSAKETFTFADRGGDSITLRPEGTAGVVRAAIENNLIAQEGSRQKLFYIGPNFRYERPQKGRLRQHHQFGVEAFGIAEPEQDVECILLQLDFYRRCGLKDFVLHVNSLGDSESKQRFAEHIVTSLTPHKASLSEDSQRRLSANPLRILDSKDPRDRELTSKLFGLEFLSPSSNAHLDRVQKLLKDADVNCFVDGKLVRGFDYYTGTLWEVTTSGLGSQNAIGGGGRYDNLVESLGGRPTPGVGFGIGIERLLMALEAQQVVLSDPRRPWSGSPPMAPPPGRRRGIFWPSSAPPELSPTWTWPIAR